MAELPEGRGAEVGQFMLLPVRPEILYGVQLGGIGRQEFHPEPALLLTHEIPHGAAAMSRQSIPDNQQFARNVTQQVRQKLDDLRTADRAGKQTEVKIPPRHARHGRQGLPIEVVLQHRGLSPRRPGTAAVRSLAQSALVDEDYGTAFLAGFFLISGQRLCFQCRIFGSSRSKARPVGR